MERIGKIESLQEISRQATPPVRARAHDAPSKKYSETSLTLWHPYGMAKAIKKAKAKRSKMRTTEWNVGQPMMFPAVKAQPGIKSLAQEAVKEGLRGPFRAKRAKQKKK